MIIMRDAQYDGEALLIANAAEEADGVVLAITDGGNECGGHLRPPRYKIWISLSGMADHERQVNLHIDAVLQRDKNKLLALEEDPEPEPAPSGTMCIGGPNDGDVLTAEKNQELLLLEKTVGPHHWISTYKREVVFFIPTEGLGMTYTFYRYCKLNLRDALEIMHSRSQCAKALGEA